MILIIESDPQFVATKDLVFHTSKGPVEIEKGSAVGLLKTEDGYINLGRTGDVLEFNNRTVIKDLLDNCQPANFELIRDEGGDSIVSAVLMEGNMLLEEKLSRITLRESNANNILPVQKVRFLNY